MSLKTKHNILSESTNVSNRSSISSLSNKTDILHKSDHILSNSSKITMENLFDAIIDKLEDEKCSSVFELLMQPIFESTQTVFWMHLPQLNTLHSPSFSVSVPYSNSLLLTALNSKVPLALSSQNRHPNFHSSIDTKIIQGNLPVLFIPVMDRDNTPIGVMQFARKVDNTFTNVDLTNAMTIVSKFKIYSTFIFTPQKTINNAFNLVQIEPLHNSVSMICSSLARMFKCRKAELWLYRRNKNMFLKFDETALEETQVPSDKLGVAGFSLLKSAVVDQKNVGDHPNYLQTIDGFPNEPVLCMPFLEKSKRIWTVVLRGRKSPPYFSPNDKAKLKAVVPFAVQSISSAVLPQKIDNQSQQFQERLSALLEIAEALSGVLQIDQLIPLIMSKAAYLLKAERCSLFLVDFIKNELISTFHGGLSDAIRIPIGTGIAGTTATTGEVVNISDAYNDPRFDKSIDLVTGFRTKSILAMPIYNNRSEIIGVTEVINKCGGGTFDEEDCRLLMGFNVFCGISLDNAKLYEASINLAHQVRTFVDASASINQETALRSILMDILENAEITVNARRATLYRYEKGKEMTIMVKKGAPSTVGTVFAMKAVEMREPLIFSAEEVAKVMQELNLKNAVDEMMKHSHGQKSENVARHGSSSSKNTESSDSNSRVSKILDGTIKTETISEVLCCLPLFNSDGCVVGVLELSSPQRLLKEDIKLLDCFAIFAAVSLERAELKNVASLGSQELEVKEWLSPEEREKTDIIPEKLKLSINETAQLWSLNFDATEWEGIKSFKAIFTIFDRFKFRENYNISNEKLFRFICDIRDTYNNVPYHNWRHAVDVTQFVTYQLIISGVEKILTNKELLAIIVAALCHDANHDGFTNIYNVKAETPLGILFKNQSVMETHHCEIAISILTKEETNLFSEILGSDAKAMWSTLIQLILATDMSKHFTIIQEFKALTDEGKFDPTNVIEHRLLLMKMIIKAADISNVSRPFDLANRWCDVLCEEFFRQGDLEMASGMEYTSDLNDREHLNKSKSQIGFYTSVCLPLYQALANAIQPLDVNAKSVEANLDIWKKEAARNEEMNKK